MKNHQEIKLGILGGGQLGRMLIQSAIDFNIQTHVLDPDADAPCKHIANSFAVGKLTDYDTVYAWGKSLDLITIEIENVNTEALIQLRNEGVAVYPQPEIIALIQNKQLQKNFFKNNNFPTADFLLTQNKEEVEGYAHYLPAVHKLAKAGYDGKGVVKINTVADFSKAFDLPGVLEKMVDFEKELSVVVARSASGRISTFPVTELVFHPEQNLVEYLFSPARIAPHTETEATALATAIAEKLSIVGLLAVEMFLTKEGNLLVNELAPRPHNSGHHTIKGNYTSQFEQHLRAIFDFPLGDPRISTPSAMVNLLGEPGYNGIANYSGLKEVLAIPGVYVHLYGKKFTKPYRKMGHVTIVDEQLENLFEKVSKVKALIKVVA